MTDCDALGPNGARCIKMAGHISRHGGLDRAGDWRSWLP